MFQILSFSSLDVGPIIPYFVSSKTKGRISKKVFQENKALQIFRKTNISYPLICIRVPPVHFWENFACFVFLKHPFWDSPFYLITDDYLSSKTCETKGTVSAIFFMIISHYDCHFVFLTYLNDFSNEYRLAFSHGLNQILA